MNNNQKNYNNDQDNKGLNLDSIEYIDDSLVPDSDNRNKNKKSVMKEIFYWVQAIVFAVVIALLIRAYIAEPVKVIGSSMEDTMNSGQRLIVYKLGYLLNPPSQGDIIVLKLSDVDTHDTIFQTLPILERVFPPFNEVDYIKRVIALPGDKIDINDGDVYINGEIMDEHYIKGVTMKNNMELPTEVPPEHVFVLGDNRENSRDSREIGFIPFDRIKGRAVFRIWPLNKAGVVN